MSFLKQLYVPQVPQMCEPLRRDVGKARSKVTCFLEVGMSSVAEILLMILNLAKWIIIIQAVLSWLVAFNILNVSQPIVNQIWSGLNRVTEPVYRPIRERLPSMGGMDFTPVIVLIAIIALQTVIANNAF
jgi:YggT family protein